MINVEKFAADKCGIYVHIPYCKAKCAYCSFVSGSDFSTQKLYVEALLHEIRDLRGKKITADTIYIGGGTPSCLYRGAIDGIISTIRNSLHVTSDAEITVEANPESCSRAFADEIRSAGVNRVSIGLQSANDNTLAQLGRVHTCADFVNAIEILQSKGFCNISSDMILGLPGENKIDIDKCIKLLADRCAHISVYALTIEEGTPLCRSGYLPDDDMTANMYDYACRLLGDYGFLRYEVSNFAKNSQQSRHNKKYWTMRPYIGVGVASHGYDGDRTRYYHTDSIADYITGNDIVDVKLSDCDLYNEYIMLALRTERGIDEKDFESRFGFSFFEHNAKTAERYIKSGIIVRNDGYIRIAPDKMFVMNGIIEDFMAD